MSFLFIRHLSLSCSLFETLSKKGLQYQIKTLTFVRDVEQVGVHRERRLAPVSFFFKSFFFEGDKKESEFFLFLFSLSLFLSRNFIKKKKKTDLTSSRQARRSRAPRRTRSASTSSSGPTPSTG